jgi:hypothetical protein
MKRTVILYSVQDPVSKVVTKHRFVIVPYSEKLPEQPFAERETCIKDARDKDSWVKCTSDLNGSLLGLILTKLAITVLHEEDGERVFDLGEFVLPDPRED